MSALLQLQNIHKAYDGLRVLDDVSLSLAPGEIVSLLGPSGCGKSTLLRIAAGLDQDFSGALEFNPLLQFGRGTGIGVVFQEPRLMPWLNVAQNVSFADGWIADEKWVQQLLRDVGLSGHANALPKQLSGGQAQRAAIARGLYGKPHVLLLDEPISAVDAFTRMKLQDLLSELAERYEIAVLLVTHDLDEAFYLSDRVLILGGTPSRLQRELAVPLAIAFAGSGLGALLAGWASTRLLERGVSVNRVRKGVMLVSALLVAPLPLVLQLDSFWPVAVMIGVVMAGHQGFSLSIFSTITDVVPHAKVGRVTSFGAFMGNMGGVAISLITGRVLDAGFGFVPLFVFAASSYLIALAWFQWMLPNIRRDPASFSPEA